MNESESGHHMAYRRVKEQLHSVLNSAQIRGVWPVSGPGHFTPKKEALVPTDYEAEWAQDLV